MRAVEIWLSGARFAPANCPPVSQTGSRAGRTEMRVITQSDLKEALCRDQVVTESNNSEAALFPQEDLKWTLPNG